MNSRKKGMTLAAKQRTAGWLFLAPASIMIAVMSFYPDDPCIHYFTADRSRRKHEICRSDLQ